MFALFLYLTLLSRFALRVYKKGCRLQIIFIFTPLSFRHDGLEFLFKLRSWNLGFKM